MSSPYPPVTLPNTEVRPLKSSIVDDTYRLHISLPVTYANSDRTYPVVYLADGNGLFPLVRSIADGLSAGLEIPRLIVVGIGYDTERSMDWERYRERDLLPTDASAKDASRRQAFTRTGIRRGQAGRFLRFIRSDGMRHFGFTVSSCSSDTTAPATSLSRWPVRIASFRMSRICLLTFGAFSIACQSVRSSAVLSTRLRGLD